MEDSPICKSVVPIIFGVNGGATCRDRTMLVRTNNGQPATRGLFLLGGEVERFRLRCHRAIDMNRFSHWNQEDHQTQSWYICFVPSNVLN